MEKLDRRTIAVDGATLEVYLGGAGEPAICTSHPFNARSPDTLELRASLGRLAAVNPRGLGHSSAGRGPDDYTFRQQIEDLEAVRRQLGIARWVFWGISGGGCLGLLYALAHPRSLSGLIVEYMGPSGRQFAEDAGSTMSPQHPQYRQDLAPLAAGGPLERRPAVLLASAEWVKLRADGRRPWVLLQEGRPLAFGSGTEQNCVANEEFVSVFDVRDRLGEISIPTLVVAGRRDDLVPLAYCELLRAGIARSELVVLDESGHGDVAPGSADDEKHRAALRGFLAGLARETSAAPL